MTLDRSWVPILVPPLVFLVLQSVNYALEPWACENQLRLPLHLTAAFALAICLAGVALAWRAWQRAGSGLPDDRGGKESIARFLAVVGVSLSVFSALAIAILWLSQLMMPPCVR